ncbi:putative reverse transcriptase domain-containing protein [Tanacetum coccineum]
MFPDDSGEALAALIVPPGNTTGAGGPGNVKEGAIELCRWFEKMESTFGISECAERSKVKGKRKSWDDMKKMMLEELCPEEEISRMEDELRNLRLRDHDIAANTNQFNELVLLCPEKVYGWKEKNAEQSKEENGKVEIQE